MHVAIMCVLSLSLSFFFLYVFSLASLSPAVSALSPPCTKSLLLLLLLLQFDHVYLIGKECLPTGEAA